MSTPAYTEQSLGKRGSFIVTSTNQLPADTKNFSILVAGPSGATISSITCTNKNNAQALQTALPAGYITYGNFSAVSVSSGSIEAYYS